MTKTEKEMFELSKDKIAELGYKLYDVLYVKESSEWYLRFFIQKKDSKIDLDDCEKVSNMLSDLLDEKDPISESYNLEVSSCGLEPHLREPSHFEEAIGKEVLVKLFKPLNGKKEFSGILTNYKDEEIEITNEGDKTNINLKDITSAKILYNWEELENE